MIVESKGNNVKGILIEIKEEHYENVTQIIDNLEGYEPDKHGNSAYTREIRQIDCREWKCQKRCMDLHWK